MFLGERYIFKDLVQDVSNKPSKVQEKPVLVSECERGAEKERKKGGEKPGKC